jgi:hypothetical protein
MKAKITAITTSAVTPPMIPHGIVRTCDVICGSEDPDADADENAVEDTPVSEDFVEADVETGNKTTRVPVVGVVI